MDRGVARAPADPGAVMLDRKLEGHVLRQLVESASPFDAGDQPLQQPLDAVELVLVRDSHLDRGRRPRGRSCSSPS